MNHASVKRTLDGKKFDEPTENLQNILEKLLMNFNHVDVCVNFTKDLLAECCETLEDLRSQIVLLESRIGEITANNQKQSADTDQSDKERSRLKRHSDQEIIEEIIVEGDEKFGDSDYASGMKSIESRLKRQRTNTIDDDISIITHRRNDICSTPGTSREATTTTKSKKIIEYQDEQSVKGKEIMETTAELPQEDVVETALRKTKGVLSAQEFQTFLHLAEDVQDPVQLAKVSFTSDIKMLFFQLMTFHFHLRVANDVAEKVKDTSSTNRDLESKVQSLIHTFRAEL